MAPRTPHWVNLFLVPLIPLVHQQLSGHVRLSGSRLGLGQHGAEEGRVPSEVYSALLQQKDIIPEVEDKSIIMFFKKGLRDSSLIRKLTMRNPRMSEEMLVIANKYALAEEATLDTREQKKDKEMGHSD
jgi:hypothetical protein